MCKYKFIWKPLATWHFESFPVVEHLQELFEPVTADFQILIIPKHSLTRMTLTFVQLPSFVLTFLWFNCPFYTYFKKEGKKRYPNSIPWLVPQDPNLLGERTIFSLRTCQAFRKGNLRSCFY